MVEQRSPKPRVLGSSPSTPGCEIPRKPFMDWRSGVFPCAQNLGLSGMVLQFFARFCLVFHRRNIKNAPRDLAEGGKGVVGVRLAGTCGGRSLGRRVVLGWWKTGRECSIFAKTAVDRKTACRGLLVLCQFFGIIQQTKVHWELADRRPLQQYANRCKSYRSYRNTDPQRMGR